MKDGKESQKARLLKLLQEGRPVSTPEILRRVYNLGGDEKGIARIASRITDLRDDGYVIDSAPGKLNKKIWWYVMRNPNKESVEEKPEKKVVHKFETVMVNGQRITREIIREVAQ